MLWFMFLLKKWCPICSEGVIYMLELIRCLLGASKMLWKWDGCSLVRCHMFVEIFPCGASAGDKNLHFSWWSLAICPVFQSVPSAGRSRVSMQDLNNGLPNLPSRKYLNGYLNGKIIYTWGSFHCHVWFIPKATEDPYARGKIDPPWSSYFFLEI